VGDQPVLSFEELGSRTSRAETSTDLVPRGWAGAIRLLLYRLFGQSCEFVHGVVFHLRTGFTKKKGRTVLLSSTHKSP